MVWSGGRNVDACDPLVPYRRCLDWIGHDHSQASVEAGPTRPEALDMRLWTDSLALLDKASPSPAFSSEDTTAKLALGLHFFIFIVIAGHSYHPLFNG